MEKILYGNMKRFHLVGVGGIGMFGLCKLLIDKGCRVSGSDLVENEYVVSLVKSGLVFSKGHCADAITKDIECLCYSSAVGDDNPEISRARELKIPVVKRARLLSEIVEGSAVIGICGSHGKTTTSALLSFVLKELGFNVGAYLGGVLINFKETAWWGRDLFIVELDESDGSFLHFKPEYAIITNIDREHIDYYKTEENIRNSFTKFILNVQISVVACGDDSGV